MEEKDIRPADLLNKYLELSRIDSETCFIGSKREQIPCPACDTDKTESSFEKWGFEYVTCRECGTLYQSPRPERKNFEAFYLNSPSARYWSREFFPAVAEARRKHLFAPKVTEISRMCREKNFFPDTLVDVGAGYGLFLEEWKKKFPQTRLIALEPNEDLAAVCSSKGLEVRTCFGEKAMDQDIRADMAVSLEVIEHVHDPASFCQSLNHIVRPKGKVLLTGLSSDGFDIQVLQENSKSVSPPHHLNFFSISGFIHLMQRAGFTHIHVTTPGKLDVSIVSNAFKEDREVLTGQRFISHLINLKPEVIESFQNFLSRNLLSSHCWVLAEK